MQTGQIIHTFTAKDGREVILRSLKWEDLDDCLTLINALIDEQADITLSDPISRDTQIQWLSNRLAAIEKGEVVQIVAEVNEHIIANSELEIKTGQRSHVGDIGIIVLKEYTRARVFRECGRIPGEIYKNGQYIDHITMVKILDETNVSSS